MVDRSAGDRDRNPTERMVEILREPVTDDVRRFLGSADPDVDDVIQESLVASLQYLDGDVESEPRAIRLAVTISRNRCRDLLRRRHRWRSADIDDEAGRLPSPGPSPLDSLERSQLRDHLLAALADVSPDCRKLLLLKYMADASTGEICRRLGLKSPQTFYYRRAGCLRRLRNVFVKRTSRRP